MATIARFLLSAALFLGVSASACAQAVTYNFTGVAVAYPSGTLASIPIGAAVSGTVTFDYSVGNPANAMGTPGNTSFFYAGTTGGTLATTPANPGALVFSMTANVDGFIYGTLPAVANDPNYYNYAYGGTNALSPGNYLVAEEYVQQPSGFYTSSFFQVDSAGNAVNSFGYPTAFSPTDASLGDEGAFFVGSVGGQSGYVGFDITSLTPVSVVTAVPEPSTYAMMVAGLLMLGGAILRRKSPRLSEARSLPGFA